MNLLHKSATKNKKVSKLLWFAIVVLFSLLFVSIVTTPHKHQQFTSLAESFLEGKTYFLEEPENGLDSTLFKDNYYWPQGPFPGVILMPFVLLFKGFHLVFWQWYLHIVLVASVFLLVYKLARFYMYSKTDSLILSVGFVFSSSFLGIAALAYSYWFAQVTATVLLFLFILEYICKKRLYLLAILAGCALLTRTSLIFMSVLILGDILFITKVSIKKKIVIFLEYCIPLGFFVLLFLGYNYIRFGNILDQGYANQILLAPEVAKAREYGLVNLIHLPGNLYYFLLAGPLPVLKDGVSQVLAFPFLQANPWGMSALITSPWIVYLFFLKERDRLSLIIFATVFCIAIPIFMYYGIGVIQFGYRYSLDFLPFVFWLLIKDYRINQKQLSPLLTKLLLIPAFTNFYLFLTLYH